MRPRSPFCAITRNSLSPAPIAQGWLRRYDMHAREFFALFRRPPHTSYEKGFFDVWSINNDAENN